MDGEPPEGRRAHRLSFSSRLRGEGFALALAGATGTRPLLAQAGALSGGALAICLSVSRAWRRCSGESVAQRLHAPLHALLLLRLHRRVALGDAIHLRRARLEAFRFRLERREVFCCSAVSSAQHGPDRGPRPCRRLGAGWPRAWGRAWGNVDRGSASARRQESGASKSQEERIIPRPRASARLEWIEEASIGRSSVRSRESISSSSAARWFCCRCRSPRRRRPAWRAGAARAARCRPSRSAHHVVGPGDAGAGSGRCAHKSPLACLREAVGEIGPAP